VRALQFQPGAVAIEGLFQRSDDHARQSRFDLADRPAQRRRGVDKRVAPPVPPGHLHETADGVDHTHPLRETHALSLKTKTHRIKQNCGGVGVEFLHRIETASGGERH
jgi:hypothetical protein